MRRPAYLVRIAVALALCQPLIAQRAGAGQRWQMGGMLLGLYGPVAASHTNYIAARERGFNVVIRAAPEALPLAEEDQIAAIVKHPLFSGADSSALDDAQQRSRLDDLVQRLKPFASFYGYYLGERVSKTGFAALGRMVAYLRQRDPEHLAFVGLLPITASSVELGLPTYQEYLDEFVKTVDPDLLCYYFTPFASEGDAALYLQNLAAVRRKSLEAHLPFALVVRAGATSRRAGPITPNQLRWLVGTALAYGARGVTFDPFAGTPKTGGIFVDGVLTELGAAASQLNSGVNHIVGNLLLTTSQGVYHAGKILREGEPLPADAVIEGLSGGEFVIGLFKGDRGQQLAVVCNADWERSALALIKLRGAVKNVMEQQLDTGMWRYLEVARKPAAGGSAVLPLSFKPGEARLLDIR